MALDDQTEREYNALAAKQARISTLNVFQKVMNVYRWGQGIGSVLGASIFALGSALSPYAKEIYPEDFERLKTITLVGGIASITLGVLCYTSQKMHKKLSSSIEKEEKELARLKQFY